LKFRFLFCWFLHIGLNVKICEESEKEGTKEEEKGHIDFWVVAIHEERCTGVNTPCDKLDQLHTCDVFFPPKIFLDRGTEAGHEVVEVHDDMDTDVEEHEECGVTTSNKLEEEPYNNWHHGMVDNMKGGHLVVLVPHHHEEGVHEVCELGEEVPPHSGSHEGSIPGVGVVHWLTNPIVFSTQPKLTQSGENPEAEEGLEKIVSKHEFLNIKSWSSLHKGWSSKSDHVVIKETENKGWPR